MKSAALFLPLFACAITAALGQGPGGGSLFIEFPHGYVTGGWSGKQWLNSEEAGKSAKPGTVFRIHGLKGPGGVYTLAKASADVEVCPDVWLADPRPEEAKPGIAVAASWDAQPRPVKIASNTQEVYLKAVTEVLLAEGIRHPKPVITQHLRMDLEGDGEEEVLIAATHYAKGEEGLNVPVSASAGDYSFVALRRVIGGKVVTQVLDGEFYEKAAEFNAPNVHEVGGVLDLDGDGTLEIVLHFHYYEGGGTTVWKVGPKRAERVLELGCGV